MPVPPGLTEQHVRDWTAPRFFERGQGYFRQGRIRNPRRAGRTLKAACQGSQPQPYRVEAALSEEDGIASARCSCPMGEGGYCKHVVALLLTWLDAPDSFTETEALNARLQRFSKAQLVALASEMIDRHPDLEMLLSLPLIGGESPTEPVDPEQLRRQVRRALDQAGGYDYDYSAISRAERDVQHILDLGDQFAERGAVKNAVTVYQVLAETIRAQYGDFFDPEGDILWFISSCSDQLGALLESTGEQAVRRAILKELFDTYAWDVQQGGYGIGDAAYGVLLGDLRPEEQHRAAEWAREAFEQSAPGWAREAFAELLLDLDEKQPEAEQLDDKEYLAICRRAGLTVTLIWKLLALGRHEEALKAARHAGDYELYRVADLFVEHGHAGAVRTLITERLPGEPDRRLVEWLRDYARDHDDPQAAFDLSERLFWQRPSAERYRALRDAGQALDVWDEERAALIEHLEHDENYSLLAKIYLEDGDYDAALRGVHRTGTGLYGVPGASLKLQVAEAAAGEHPHRAVDLYLERACHLIDQRGRSNYARAAEYLRRIRDIYGRIEASEQWDDLIAMMRDENDNLPAFQDELDKAGL